MQKTFDLEKRTLMFSKAVVQICNKLPRNPINDRLVNQVVGSSGSVGANYREANDSLGKKDFLQRLRIARREAKEAQYWLELLIEANTRESDSMQPLIKEAHELKLILSAIIEKST